MHYGISQTLLAVQERRRTGRRQVWMGRSATRPSRFFRMEA